MAKSESQLLEELADELFKAAWPKLQGKEPGAQESLRRSGYYTDAAGRRTRMVLEIDAGVFADIPEARRTVGSKGWIRESKHGYIGAAFERKK